MGMKRWLFEAVSRVDEKFWVWGGVRGIAALVISFASMVGLCVDSYRNPRSRRLERCVVLEECCKKLQNAELTSLDSCALIRMAP